MRVAHKAGDAYYHITARQTRHGDFAAKLILLVCLTLGYAAYRGLMEAVHLVFISPLLIHDTRHDW